VLAAGVTAGEALLTVLTVCPGPWGCFPGFPGFPGSSGERGSPSTAEPDAFAPHPRTPALSN